MFFRILMLCLVTALPAGAQSLTDDGRLLGAPIEIDRSATGGAQTLEDILARQDALRVDDAERRAALSGDAPNVGDLAGRGAASDSDLWRGVRFDAGGVTTQNRGPAATTLIQDGGMAWYEFRAGPLKRWGAIALGATLALLAVFYLLRGKIRLEHPRTGRTVTRFSGWERFGHWLMGGSFILLAITGLLVLFGRTVVIPVLGHEAWAPMAVASKWVHNNVAWAFMIGLAWVFLQWVWHNMPDRTDLTWIAKGGGIVGRGHPPAKRFNAGQKLIFWSVVIGGASLSASGLSLLFPFELPMFAVTFEKINALGVMGWVGLPPLPEALSPQEEMQLAAAWHGIVAFVLIAIAMAHIYIGSVGMEGAFDAVGTGEVEETWAREHHSIWAEKAIAERDGRVPPASASGTPAE